MSWLAESIVDGCDLNAVLNKEQRCIMTAGGTIFRHGKGAKASNLERDLVPSLEGGLAMGSPLFSFPCSFCSSENNFITGFPKKSKEEY